MPNITLMSSSDHLCYVSRFYFYWSLVNGPISNCRPDLIFFCKTACSFNVVITVHFADQFQTPAVVYLMLISHDLLQRSVGDHYHALNFSLRAVCLKDNTFSDSEILLPHLILFFRSIEILVLFQENVFIFIVVLKL